MLAPEVSSSFIAPWLLRWPVPDTDSLLALGSRFDGLNVNLLRRMVMSYPSSMMPCVRFVF